MSDSKEPTANAAKSDSVQPTGNASPQAVSEQEASGEQAGALAEGTSRPAERRGQGPRPRRDREERREGDDLSEKVVYINRCAKVVKGGRRFSFSALIVVGDKKGKVGIGFGKANEVAEAIRKGSADARRSLKEFVMDGTTIPHQIIGEHGGGRVLLRPASEGTGIIAGGGMRAVLEVSGLHDVLAKNMGSNNHANVVKATLNALEQLRNREQIYATRGKKVAEKAAL